MRGIPDIIAEATGAVFGWVWSEYFGEYRWSFLYWPVLWLVGLDGAQMMVVPVLGYYAGFRDWTRGRHWDRRSRYGYR